LYEHGGETNAMPMTVDWDDAEHTLILATISDPTTWDDFNRGVDEIVRLAHTVPHRVDVICDAGPTPMPPGSPLPYLKRAFQLMPKNVGVVVSPITNVFARTMSTIVGQAYFGSRYKVVESLEAAREAVERARVKTG
jgi:hypothetical protein